jgi:MFS family permease
MIRKLKTDPGNPLVSVAAPPSLPRLDRRFVTAALMLVMVLASMEMTITATAMPTIIGQLHGLEYYAWVTAIYLVAGTISQPLYGRLADVLGRKRVIVFSIVLFCAASVQASFAQNMTQLIVARGIQGLGAGGIMPVVLTIIGDIFTLEQRARIQGLFSAVWGTSALAGPALGALLVKTLGWRSIFYVNLPFGLIALLMLLWKYHDREKPHSTDLDLPGLAALTVGCGSLMALVAALDGAAPNRSLLAVLAVVALAALSLFVWIERRAANPILAPNLVMRRAIGPSLVASFIFGMGFISLDTFVPLYVQGGRGGGVAAAAGVVTPVMLTWALSGLVAAPALVKWGFQRTALIGTVLILIGFAGLLAGALLGAPHAVITAVLAVSGFGFGFASMSYLLAAQDAVPWQQRGIVTASVGFFRTMGGAIGVGLLGALFNLVAGPKLAQFTGHGLRTAELLDPQLTRNIDPHVLRQIQSGISSGLIWVFAAMLLSAVLLLLVSTMLPSRRSDESVRPTEAVESLAG